MRTSIDLPVFCFHLPAALCVEKTRCLVFGRKAAMRSGAPVLCRYTDLP